MDAATDIGRNPVSKHHIQPEYGDEQADAGRDCRTRLAKQNIRRERGHGNMQPYHPVDPYSATGDDDTHIMAIYEEGSSIYVSVTTIL